VQRLQRQHQRRVGSRRPNISASTSTNGSAAAFLGDWFSAATASGSHSHSRSRPLPCVSASVDGFLPPEGGHVRRRACGDWLPLQAEALAPPAADRDAQHAESIRQPSASHRRSPRRGEAATAAPGQRSTIGGPIVEVRHFERRLRGRCLGADPPQQPERFR
jgi:hypothetical protein